jgi:iron complex outermembrane receptor protein
MTKRALRLSASVGVLAALLTFGGAARAAEATADQALATATTVAPLTITAERRTINLQTAPVAASVIPGSQLQSEGIETLDDLQFHTPSLTVTDFGQGNLFNIRGIGKDLTNVQTPSGVVTYWDGVASFPGFFQDAPYYDIANVEVLRGPQGTFAGQNATGGAVFITTNDPSLGGFHGDIEGQFGSYNDGLLRGAVNIPVSDTFAIRIAMDGERRDSFYRVSGPWTTPFNDTPGRLLEGAFRIGLLWQPNDHFKVTLKGFYNYIDHGGSLADPSIIGGVLNRSDPFQISNNTNNFGTDKFWGLTLNAAYTFESGIVLRSVSSYQYGITNENLDLDGTSALPLTFSDYGQEAIYSQEVNLVSPDKGPLRWVGGLYFQSDTVDLPPVTGFDIGLPAGVFDINIIYHTPKATDAVFVQVSYDITPTLQVEAGARFTHSSFTLDDNNFFNNNPATGVVLHATTDDNAVTGKVALNYRPDENNTLYAFVAEGHKQNGINTDPATPFGPEEVTDFEGGWKPTFLGAHLRAQLGLYYTLYRHFQLQFTTPILTNLIQNVGGTTTALGVEAEAQAVFGPLTLNGGVSYEHSRLGAVTITDPATGLAVALGGRPLPLAPDWTANIGAQYAFDLPGDATLTPRIDYSYTAGQWSTPFQHLGEFLPARNLVNAEIAYAERGWKLALYAQNAFNLHYIIATNVGLRYAGAPGEYGFRVEKRF